MMKRLLAIVLTIAMMLSMSVVVSAETSSGTVTYCYTAADRFWGEATANSLESLVIEIYEGETKIASASLNNVNNIIDGDVYVTWNIKFGGNSDEHWAVEWAEGYPKYDMNPTVVKLVSDKNCVAENEVRFNGPDDLNKIVAFAEGYTGGVKAYTTLEEAIGNFNGRKVNVVRDVTESIDSFNGCTLTTNVEGGVTITNTYDEYYVYANDFNIGSGVAVNASDFFYETDGVNTVEGTLTVANTFYQGYDAKTTVKNGGRIAVGGATILRYNEAADAGIYIYGDGNDSTVEFDCDYYIGAYSGTFYAEDANIDCGYFLLKNSYDKGDYANIDLTLDNSSINVVGTTDGQDSFIIDEKASVTMKNGSAIEDVRDFNILAGTDLTLNMDGESSIKATNVSVANGVPFKTVENEDGTLGIVEILPVEVTNYEELLEAIDGDALTIIMMNDIIADAKPLSNGYGKTGINILNGETLDGKGHTLSFSGLNNGTWDSAINTTGGTIKNLTIDNGFRGIFINHNSDYSAPVILENVIIDGSVYTISCDQGTNNGLTATDCTFNGWTSFAATLGKATFNNCNFGEGSGYSFCRPYVESEFNGCDFEKDYEFDANRINGNSHEFNECKYDGEDLSTGAGSEMFYNGGNVIIDGEEVKLAANPVAQNGANTFASITDAAAAAKDGDVITLIKDVVENNVVIGTKPEENTAALLMAGTEEITGTGIVLDLNGNTLTGNIIVYGDASATIKNGKIVNEDSKVSAIQSFGTTVLENLDVTSARHTVRVEGGITTINSGNYKIAAGKGNTLHAVNVSDGGSVVIYDGTFTGPKGTGRDSGSAVQIQANSTGTIYGGTFTGGLNSTLTAKGTLTVYDGLFDQDPKTYVAPGYASIKVNDMYGVAAKTTAGANEVIVEFAPTADENIYNINLVAGNDVINRLTSADLTFKLTSEKTDDNKDKVAYEILKYGNVNYKLEGTDRYLFNLNGVVTPDETGDVITIGQVKFGGYGKFSFEVVENAETNIVNATTISDNIVSSFVAEPETNEGQLTIDNSTLEDVEIKVPTKELTIKVEFNNAIKDKEAEYKNMKVLISGGDIINPQPVVLSEKDYVNGFKTTLTENIAYNVTVTGDGYRTARYTVTMTGDKTLTFWNNLKDAAEAIETDSDVKVKSNFLAGEIVADNDINIYDLSAVVSYFGKTGLTAADIDFIKYDLNRDGKINSVDVSFVLASWAD